MPLIMGIDTGGTYTDAVIVQRSGKNILCKAKSLTIKEDLVLGIRNSIENLHFSDYDRVSMVCLSTTLATNAIVEGRGSRIGLILIGSIPEGDLPAHQMEFVTGKLDIKGKEITCLKDKEVLSAVLRLDKRVSAVAISGFASVRNPEHELHVKRIVTEALGIPVVCAHELTSSLGFYERTVTAVLNASLIPIINDLIRATKSVLKDKGIKAPVMIVKGDGSLMQESFALQRPIETILSGPAASVIGGIFLSGQQNAVILDMGGTTTDIANVENGVVRIHKEGARVGGWLTRVEAADISTYGIGGDSWIHLNHEGQLEVGPRRVLPLCMVGNEFPQIGDDLTAFTKNSVCELETLEETDCFVLSKMDGLEELSELDREILEQLDKRPRSLLSLAHRLDVKAEDLGLERLIDIGAISRVSLTPTDLLHVQGRYVEWDETTAMIGADIMARRMRKPMSIFLEMANQLIEDKLYLSCKESFSAFGMSDPKMLKVPIVAVGGPVSAWMGPVAGRLGTSLIIPTHAEVANAVGAAVGQVMETVHALIRPAGDCKNFFFYAPWEMKIFQSLEDAKAYAVPELKLFASAIEKLAGSEQFDIVESQEDVYAEVYSTGETVYVETRLKATAIGKPKWS